MKAFTITFFVLCLMVYILAMGDAHYEPIRNFLYAAAPFVSVCAIFRANKAYGFKSAHGLSFFLIGLALLCWFIGEVLWVYYDYVLGVDPFPSLSDLFYLVAYPLFFLGLVYEKRALQFSFSDMPKSHRRHLLVFVVLFSLIVIYFEMFLAYSPDETFLNNFIQLAYGFGDLVLILAGSFVYMMARELKPGRLYSVWSSFLFALLFILVADVLFAAFNPEYLEMEWPYFQMTDLFWIAGYMMFAYTFEKALELVKYTQKQANFAQWKELF